MAEEYGGFVERIYLTLGIDLRLYKEAQMKRRITSLRDKRGFSDFDSYYQALLAEKGLLDEFIDRLTINVSEFYRNPKRWDVLQHKILPQLLDKQGTLHIWSAACSTGEEPYSIAIMLKEFYPEKDFRILATDLDKNALQQAKLGAYSPQALRDVPHTMKDNYFTEADGRYIVDPELRKAITFRAHNLLADTYPENIDLIICRNVLIYFTDKAKEIILKNFSQALGLNGVLFVGSTEQIFHADQYQLRLLDTFFYQKMQPAASFTD
ncbi:CheR family methyltransferase [Lentibacillus sediminis]|uniref:CheR family methyltransferase n=1 Tax=Lentibacillus sediminis TaxID=1940529 RepID=UPI000C1B8020|nr:protein-glutamate O-methyltransferase CheR [Lentibacillus sediminis]